MNLTDEQKTTISGWVAGGADLNEIQERLREELEITITYLETRFLIGDLNLEILDEPEPEVEESPAPEDGLQPGSEGGGGAGGVHVSVDNIAIPGTVASGKVTFSDGANASWYLDQEGRLGLTPDVEGYQPPESDVMEFQTKLQQVLQ